MAVRRVFAVVWKDLRSIGRTPSALATMLVAPLGVALILGLAFGGQGSFELQAVKTVVVNLDHEASGAAGSATSVSDTLVSVLRGKDVKDVIDARTVKTEAAARRAVDDGDAAVAVIIPKGFDAAVISGGGSAAQVEVYTDPTLEIGPAIVEGVVQQVVDGFNGVQATVAAAVQLGMVKSIGTAASSEKIAAAAEAAVRGFLAQGGAQSLAIEQRAPAVAGAESSKDPGVTGLVLAGQLVLFTFFGASIAARTILVEQEEGTLARLFTTPTSRASILGGKYLMSYLVVLLQSIVILLAGWLAFQIDWGALAPVAVLALVGCAVASGLAMLIGSLTRTLAQEGAIGAGIFLLLALLGGNFTGSFAQGGAATTVSLFTPNGWLLQAWDTTMRGGTVADIVLPVLVVSAFSAVFFVAAVLLMRRRFA
jgi:ABC-type Na+ efflux pump permease subunit